MPCPECGTTLQPDEIWLKKGSNSWYTLRQCPRCAGSGSAAGKGVFQRYKLARPGGLNWRYARCHQLPDDPALARRDKPRFPQKEQQKTAYKEHHKHGCKDGCRRVAFCISRFYFVSQLHR